MFLALLNVLTAGLSLWSNKEKTKYIDKVISLKKQYYEAYNKPPELRDDAVLDNIEFELKILSNAFASEALSNVRS